MTMRSIYTFAILGSCLDALALIHLCHTVEMEMEMGMGMERERDDDGNRDGDEWGYRGDGGRGMEMEMGMTIGRIPSSSACWAISN